jgi:APA family basic amino acid/polyamine antiporter
MKLWTLTLRWMTREMPVLMNHPGSLKENRRKRMQLFRTKPLDKILAEADKSGEGTLNKTLGATALTLLGVGAVIGTGIFVLTGQAAGRHAGPAVILAMIVAGIVSALAALCYSEFASSVPISGSAYAYGYATLGEFVAWVIGWDLILEYAFGASDGRGRLVG